MTDSAPIPLRVKVVPGASRSEIAGWIGGSLKVRVAAPPEKGKANRAVAELLAQVLALPVRQIRLVSGGVSAHKRFAISGLNAEELQARLTSIPRQA